jgi:hypothetical protein
MKIKLGIIKIRFVDFWVDYNRKSDNYFVELLSLFYDVEISENPDILFYSCFGQDYLKYKCTKIFFTPENCRPNYFECDYSISFDYSKSNKNIRIPLWFLYFLSYQKDGLYKEQHKEDLFANWKMRKNFCCIIVSNPSAKPRIKFYEMLNHHKKVDSAGRWNNTIGKELESGTKNKFDFIRSYRFVISFENSSYPGYTTEKILEPLLAGSIPIYWGDTEITSEFNERRFINVKSELEFEKHIQKILDIENNNELAKEYFVGSIFNEEKVNPDFMDKELIAKKLYSWIESARKQQFRGISLSFKGVTYHYLKMIKSTVREKIIKLIRRT